MAKLSDTQLTILSAACQRGDRSVYPITSKLTGGALDKVLNSLLAKGLIEDIPAGRDATIWRADDDGFRFTLRATEAAAGALGIGDAPQGATMPAAKPRVQKAEPAEHVGKGRARGAKGKRRPATGRKANVAPAKAKGAASKRTGTKQEKLIAMLRRNEGVTVDEVVKALDWQAHTVRGAIAGALKKKLGLKIVSDKVEDRGRVYRITD
jgi:transposase